MGILARIFGREPMETRDAAGPIISAAPGLTGGYGALPSGDGALSPMAAENLSAVLAAVNAISSGVASLAPLAFRREASGGRAELPYQHWLSRLLRDPSERYSYSEWVEILISSCCLHGNALAEIRSDAGGRIIGLEPIAWSHITVQILPSGRVAYDIAPPETYTGATTQKRRLFADEVLHVRDRTDAGQVVARSRLARAGGAVANVNSLQDMTAAVWRQGMRPSGYVTSPTVLTDANRKLSETLLQRFTGTANAGRVPLLEAGFKFEALEIDAESKQALESRRFGTEEIARIFQISPVLLQDWSRSTFTNSETAGKWFGQYTISPWSLRLQSALRRSVLGPHSDLSVELDLSSLLRGSDIERWQCWKLATEIGALSADDVRAEESWGPRRAADAAPAPPAAGEPVAP